MSEAANRKLQAIRVRTEVASGNIPPLLHEVRHALEALSMTGASNIIDLKSIPLAPGEVPDVGHERDGVQRERDRIHEVRRVIG